MIVVQLRGGLGNQLFQYALGRRLAIDRDVPLKLDTSRFRYDGQRFFRLDRYNINVEVASREDVLRAKGGAGFVGRMVRLSDRLRPYYRRRIVNEAPIGFDQNILGVPRTAYLQGYWQDERYFRSIGSLLRTEVSLKGRPSPASERLAQEIAAHDSVGLHVRRGDYVSHPAASQEFWVLPQSYYLTASKYFADQLADPRFYLFSDDLDWVRDNLRLDWPTKIVSHNSQATDYEDLWLMSLCRHQIIANSSFSWWSAWLNAYSQKMVIAPAKWFRDPGKNAEFSLPPDWIRI